MGAFVEGTFRPREGETFLFMVDGSVPERNSVVETWRMELARHLEGRCDVLPLLYHEVTRDDGADLPETGVFNETGKEVGIDDVLRGVQMVWSLPAHSATRPLLERIRRGYGFRCASSPGFQLDMLGTVMTEDPKKIQERGRILRSLLEEAIGVYIEFESGHPLYFDKRGVPLEDDLGELYKPPYIGNVPFGEICFPQHEGSLYAWLGETGNAAEAKRLEEYYDGLNREGSARVRLRREDKSIITTDTHGFLPVYYGEDMVVYRISNGFIVNVLGGSETADGFRRRLERSPLWGYIAEGAFGLNSRARASAPEVLEKEKATIHIARGNSAQAGGYATPLPPDENYHHDEVLVRPAVRRASLVYPNGGMQAVMIDGEYMVFGELNFRPAP